MAVNDSANQAVGRERIYNARARDRGIKLAQKMIPGMWCLVEARADPNGEYLWLAKAVARECWGGKCVQKATTNCREIVGGKSVRFTKGDYKIAVQFYGKQDGTDRLYKMDSPPGLAVFNCTELLAINATPKLVGGPEEQQTRVARRRSCRKRNNRGGEAATGGDDVVAAEEARRRREELQTLATQRVWKLSESDEAIALAEVRSIGG